MKTRGPVVGGGAGPRALFIDLNNFSLYPTVGVGYISRCLRDAGWRIDYPLGAARVGKQFQTAEAMGAKITLLYGDEWPAVKMKKLATREEVLVPNEELLARVGAALSS